MEQMNQSKRQRKNSLPTDVYNELVTVFNPKCTITLQEECDESNGGDEEYIPLDDMFRQYTISIKMSTIFETTLSFAVDKNYDDDGKNCVFLYGVSDDEFTYESVSTYSFDEIEKVLHMSCTWMTSLPPFLDFTDDKVTLTDQNSETTISLDKIDKTSLLNFKKRYDDLFRWILNKQKNYM